jgi:hypothetical protein
MRKKVYLTLLALVGWMVFGPEDRGFTRVEDRKEEPKPDPQKVKELMQRKLETAQKLLGAITVNDLEKTAKLAEELGRIRKQAAFKVYKTEEYEMWSRAFDESAQKLIKAARDKNLDVAKLTYLEMTLNCFHCHTYVRDTARTRLEIPQP